MMGMRFLSVASCILTSQNCEQDSTLLARVAKYLPAVSARVTSVRSGNSGKNSRTLIMTGNPDEYLATLAGWDEVHGGNRRQRVNYVSGRLRKTWSFEH